MSAHATRALGVRNRTTAVLLGAAYGAVTGAAFSVLTAVGGALSGKESDLTSWTNGVVGLAGVFAIFAIPIGAVLGTGIALLVQPFLRKSALVTFGVAIGATALPITMLLIPVTASNSGMWWPVLTVVVCLTGVVLYVRTARRRHDRSAAKSGTPARDRI